MDAWGCFSCSWCATSGSLAPHGSIRKWCTQGCGTLESWSRLGCQGEASLGIKSLVSWLYCSYRSSWKYQAYKSTYGDPNLAVSLYDIVHWTEVHQDKCELHARTHPKLNQFQQFGMPSFSLDQHWTCLTIFFLAGFQWKIGEGPHRWCRSSRAFRRQTKGILILILPKAC